MWTDKMLLLLNNPIFWGIFALIVAAITFSGKLSMSLCNWFLAVAFLIGCFGIYQASLPIHLTIIFCLLIGILVTGISWWLTPSLGFPTKEIPESSAKSTESTVQNIQEPELILLPPEKNQRYRWIPKQRIAIDQGIDPKHGLYGHPVFGLRNLSKAPVNGITIEWTIDEPHSASLIFLANEHFHKYYPRIEESNQTFWLSAIPPVPQGASSGSGMTVGDAAVVNIPFCEPTEPNANALEIPMPPSISNSFTIRIIATKQRPPATNIPQGWIKSSGPIIRAKIKYLQSLKEYIRYFRIESSVTTFSETASDDLRAGEWSGVEREYWSQDNFRATVAFTVVPDRPK